MASGATQVSCLCQSSLSDGTARWHDRLNLVGARHEQRYVAVGGKEIGGNAVR